MRVVINHPPYIIGEVGACHNGELESALDLIEIASENGCHAVKFQVYNADRLCIRRNAQQYHDMYQLYQLPLTWLPQLKAKARDYRLDLVLSVYDTIDLADAFPFADWLKVSSFESADKMLLDACIYTGSKLIVSTGMSTMDELRGFTKFREAHENMIAILHCISAYPTPVHDLNLSVIRAQDLDGYSDHSGNRVAGAIAVAYGAKMLEVHIRDIHTPEDNPDFKHALGPSALRAYITAAVEAQVMGGSGFREVVESELVGLPFKVKG